MIALRFISYTVLKLFAGRIKDIPWMMWLFTIIFILRYAFIALEQYMIIEISVGREQQAVASSQYQICYWQSAICYNKVGNWTDRKATSAENRDTNYQLQITNY